MKKIIVGLIASLLVALPLVAAGPRPVSALFDNAKSDACQGIGGTEKNGACTTSGPSIDTIINRVVNVFSAIVGIIAVIMIVVAGVKYITSSGDSGAVTSAKNTLLWAVVGLIVVGLAQAIVQFTIRSATEGQPPKKTTVLVREA